MKAEILVKHNYITEIAKVVGLHRNTVSAQLKGGVYSKKAEETRKIAIEQFGGVEISLKEKA